MNPGTNLDRTCCHKTIYKYIYIYLPNLKADCCSSVNLNKIIFFCDTMSKFPFDMPCGVNPTLLPPGINTCTSVVCNLDLTNVSHIYCKQCPV